MSFLLCILHLFVLIFHLLTVIFASLCGDLGLFIVMFNLLVVILCLFVIIVSVLHVMFCVSMCIFLSLFNLFSSEKVASNWSSSTEAPWAFWPRFSPFSPSMDCPNSRSSNVQFIVDQTHFLSAVCVWDTHHILLIHVSRLYWDFHQPCIIVFLHVVDLCKYHEKETMQTWKSIGAKYFYCGAKSLSLPHKH